MGINSTDLAVLTFLREHGYIKKGSSIIEIGAQQCSNDFLRAKEELRKIAELFEVTSPCPLPPPITTSTLHGLELLSEQAPASHIFWRWLGFCYKSVDIDGSHDSLFLDLNYDEVPQKERGQYQIVTNYGTTEHVANQLNAFKVIHELTDLGGIMMHHLPSQGMMNHGLVNYNAKFFWMLARSNGYHWINMDYACSLNYQELHPDIVEHVKMFNPHIVQRAKEYITADGALSVVLQKMIDTPYVAPIDVPTGLKIDNRVLEKRYWSVFQPNPFHKFNKFGETKASATEVPLDSQ